MPKTVVVGIDLYAHSAFTPDIFKEKTFDEQLNEMSGYIQKICQELDSKEKDAEWIIVWKEYGLTNKESIFIDVNQKARLKEVMSALTKDYPQLTIVSGTVATKKTIHAMDSSKIDHDKRQKIIDAYGENTYLDSFEDAEVNRVRDHALKTVNLPGFFSVVLNSAYVFNGGNCIHRHDKTASWQETGNLLNAVFRPGKGTARSAYINKKYGIEICREHHFDTLNNDIKNEGDEPPLIQFVLSSPVELTAKHMASPHMINLDCHRGVRWCTEVDKSNSEVDVYKFDPRSMTPALEVVQPRDKIQLLYDFVEEQIETMHEKLNYLDWAIQYIMGENFVLDPVQYAALAAVVGNKIISLSETDPDYKKLEISLNLFLDLITKGNLDLISNQIFEDILLKMVRLQQLQAVEYLVLNYKDKVKNLAPTPDLLAFLSNAGNDSLSEFFNTISHSQQKLDVTDNSNNDLPTKPEPTFNAGEVTQPKATTDFTPSSTIEGLTKSQVKFLIEKFNRLSQTKPEPSKASEIKIKHSR